MHLMLEFESTQVVPCGDWILAHLKPFFEILIFDFITHDRLLLALILLYYTILLIHCKYQSFATKLQDNRVWIVDWRALTITPKYPKTPQTQTAQARVISIVASANNHIIKAWYDVHTCYICFVVCFYMFEFDFWFETVDFCVCFILFTIGASQCNAVIKNGIFEKRFCEEKFFFNYFQSINVGITTLYWYQVKFYICIICF